MCRLPEPLAADSFWSHRLEEKYGSARWTIQTALQHSKPHRMGQPRLNMKRLFFFLVLILMVAAADVQAQNGNVLSNITAFVTVTNLGTNGDQFAINGNYRTLTNFVTTV